MNNLFMAKSRPPKNVIEHTREVLEFLTSLKNLYPNAFEDKVWKAIEVSINYHDYGKINSRFQNIIYEDMNLDIKLLDILNSEYKKAGVIQIPHGILSMFFIDYETVCQELGENIAKAVLMAVCYHHDRDMEISRRLLSKVVNEDLKQYLTEFASYLGLENISLYRSNIDEVDIEELTEEEWKYFALIKGILNRADYAASGCMERIEQTPYYNEQCISDKVLEKFKANSWSLRPVQKYMIDKVSSNLIVVASTGIGKTEGALLWTKDTKCFYTLPLRVSINAIYERIRGDYDYGYSELLHSDSLTYYIKEYDNKENKSVEPYLRYQQARIFASPLTICTVDQLFKFVFKANGFEPMLATLAYSTVIIDELQMYSPEVVACILYGLKQITDIGGKYAIITATFPKVLFDFMTKLRIPYEMPQKPFSNQIGPRHFIELNEGEMDYNLILSLGKKKKVLVIANTVAKAQKIYEILRDENDKDISIGLLHSNYLAKDRKLLEKEIMSFSNCKKRRKEKGIWISTQIVEASLDIDFDLLFTEMCIADSLLQRMGRCYRKREYLYKGKPNIYIYDTGNGVGRVYDKELYIFSLEALKKYSGKYFTEEMKYEYIDKVYSPEINPDIRRTKYYKAIEERLNILKYLKPMQLEKSYVDQKFRDIQSITVMPDEIYDKLLNSNAIDNWERQLSTKKITIQKKARIISEIMENTLNIRWRPNMEVDFSNDIIFRGSRIYRCRYLYDFDEENLNGEGLLISKSFSDNIQ